MAVQPMTPAQLSVTVNNTTVVYSNATGLLQQQVWSQWYIPYSELTNLGANLNNVTKIAINVNSGASQLDLYIDDIDLVPLQCVNPLVGDFNGDCVVDFDDFAHFANEWHMSGLGLQ